VRGVGVGEVGVGTHWGPSFSLVSNATGLPPCADPLQRNADWILGAF
jgi:hypothetical protein